MKCAVYILENKKGKYYIGITKLLLTLRLAKHNKGGVLATKLGRPWKVVFVEEYESYKMARDREKQIKSWHGGNAFKELVAKAAGSSNGRTDASGAFNLGSNPSPAALAIRKR